VYYDPDDAYTTGGSKSKYLDPLQQIKRLTIGEISSANQETQNRIVEDVFTDQVVRSQINKGCVYVMNEYQEVFELGQHAHDLSTEELTEQVECSVEAFGDKVAFDQRVQVFRDQVL
jgi:hypothetical protein